MEQHHDTAPSPYFITNDSSNQPALPSFAVEAAVPFDFDEWSKKAANAEYPYTPSYASYNSPGSNLSGLSAPLDSTDDDFEFMHYTNVGPSADDFGLGIHNLGDEDSGYNPTHFQSIAGGEDFPLLEDHFGNTFVYETPASNVSSPPPHSKEPPAFYPPTADHSPGSSLGDIEQPTDSRGSSVSSFHHSPRIPSTAPPGFNESLANLTFGAISNPNSPEFYARQVSSPRGISAPIDAPSPPPSATSPPPYHSHNKSLTQPLIIPPSPSLNTFKVPHSEHEQSQETAKADNMATVTATTFSSGFLQPPQDRTAALPRFSGQDSSADNEGPAIRLIPSTPVTAGGSVARGGVLRPSPLSFVPEDTSTNELAVFPPAQSETGSVDPTSNWSSQNTQPTLTYPAMPPPPERPAPSTWTSDSLLLGGAPFSNNSTNNTNLNDSPNLHLSTPLPSLPFTLSNRPRAASHSGSTTPSRPQWQDQSFFPLSQYQARQGSFFYPQQRTVNLNDVNPTGTNPIDQFNLDSLVPISPTQPHSQLHPDNPALLHNSMPNSPSLLPTGSLHPPQGPGLRRNRTTPSHRRGAWSEDISVNRTIASDDDDAAFIRSITSTDGTLLPPDVRSPPSRRGRRGSSGSVGSDRGSPYTRPSSLSGGSRNPSPIPAGQVERQNVTTPATEAASSIRRKNRAPFMCPVEGCGSTFTRQFNLKGHLRSHREERPYVCKWPKCGKGFARQHDCKRHEALHLNIRPFTCDGCGKTFARMDALNRHHKSEGGIECRKADGSELSNGGISSAPPAGMFNDFVGGDPSRLSHWGFLA